MKAIKAAFSFFTEDDNTLYAKIEVVENDPDGKQYHLYKKHGKRGDWKESYPYKTINEAIEFANSENQSVKIVGLFKNGRAIPMMEWNAEPLKHSPEQVLELRRKSYGDYKPELNRVDGEPVNDPRFVKPVLNKELALEVEVEKKFLRKELRK